MRILDTIQMAARGVTVNRMRSLLTMLGIIIGVGSVVLMVSIGKSFENYILTQVQQFGGNVIDVYPTGFEKFGRNVDSLTYEDYLAVEKLTTVESVAPIILVTEAISFGTEEKSPPIFGTTGAIQDNYSLKIDRGRFLDESDYKGAKNVIVLGSQVAEDLFANRDPLGNRVKVGSRFFTVVGVLQSFGSLLLQDLDSAAYMPFTTAKAMTGQKYLSYINLRAKTDTEVAMQDITQLLRQRHGIDNPENNRDKDDFLSRSVEQATDIIGTVSLGLTAFITLIAAISLVVGGIGIMNIMLVSVTERTKEIGLRKAVGARSRDILLQFLIEAVCLTLVGGMIGIIGGTAIGLLLAGIAAKLLGSFSFAFSTGALFVAVLMAAGVGLAFGIYPAMKAAKLSPIEAMRWE